MIETDNMLFESKIVKYRKTTNSTRIRNSRDAANVMRELFNFSGFDIGVKEVMFAAFLNTANNIVGYSLIGVGGISSTTVDVRLIAKSALDHLATAIILVHSHPSNNLNPSQADLNLTKKIKEALKLLDIELIEHLILGEVGYYSFCDEGLL